jgi:2-amino-4-hydroxy-6-hydroxymethyldihydropteridine diphosphokinase
MALAMTGVWMPAYVGIGSNLGEPVARVRHAFVALGKLDGCRLIASSPLYRSPPLGPQNQPDFVNAVAGLLTTLTPHELLGSLKRLELSLGRRTPVERWGPREIDFDILVYGAARIDSPDLKIPHVGVPERNWVLYPLKDIAPDLSVAGHGRVRDLADRLGAAGLTLIE